jgi:hypothetical protein
MNAGTKSETRTVVRDRVDGINEKWRSAPKRERMKSEKSEELSKRW